jgi:hypothetical protein
MALLAVLTTPTRDFFRSLLKLISYDREPYVPNMPVTVANSDESDSLDELIVERTVEPTIIANGLVVAMGKVFLSRPSRNQTG